MNRTRSILTLFHTSLGALALLSGSALADEYRDYAFVVTHEKATSQRQTIRNENQCLRLIGKQEEICFQMPALVRQQRSKNETSVLSVIKIATDEPNLTLKTLKASGLFLEVERDYEFTRRSPPAAKQTIQANKSNKLKKQSANNQAPLDDLPNDPAYIEQTYLRNPAVDTVMNRVNEVGSNNFDALIQGNNPININVGVIDDDFHDFTGEMTYSGGYRFTSSGDSEQGEDYQEAFGENIFCNGHGSGVAGVIGANTNNNELITGTGGNMSLYVARALKCGFGGLSLFAKSLYWLAGAAPEDVPFTISDFPVIDVEGKIQVVNVSLGAEIDSDGKCPIFAQDSINYAFERGIIVVVAAGNEGQDYSTYAPANCDNVITVGAHDPKGVFADYSNYGEGIDIAALGTSVTSITNRRDEYGWWEGTSFAAPIVTSAIAHALRVNPLIDLDLINKLLALSSNPLIECIESAEGHCGPGMLNAGRLVAMAKSVSSETNNRIEYKESAISSCWLPSIVKHFPESADICGKLKVTFAGGFAAPQAFYQLVEKNKDTQETRVVISTQQGKIDLAVNEINITEFDYDVRICNTESCDDVALVAPVDISSLNNGNTSVVCANSEQGE